MVHALVLAVVVVSYAAKARACTPVVRVAPSRVSAAV
jgi:hypothetical protein